MKTLAKIFIALILIPVSFILWLGFTDGGLRWTFEYAKPYLPAELKLTKIDGHLFGPMRLKDVEYKQDDALFTAKEIIVNWSPSALLLAEMSISKLQIDTLKIQLPKSKNADLSIQNNEPITLPEINLPWRISLNHVVINELTIQQNEDLIVVDKIKLNASTLFHKLDIQDFSIQTKTLGLSIKGRIKLTNNYSHQLETHWHTVLPSGERVTGSGRLIGDMKTTTLKQKLNQPIQATLDAELLNLLSQPQWQAKLKIPKFDITKLSKAAPVILTTLSVEGKGDLNSASLQASLNGQSAILKRPVDAQIKLQLTKHANGFGIAKLELTSEDTQLNLQGEIAEQLKLDWSLSVNELAKLYPQAKGKLQASGSITGTIDSPIIKATYKGEALGFSEYEMSSLDGSLNVDLFHWQQLKLKLLAKNLKLKESQFQSLDINADNHQLTLHVMTESAVANIVLNGKASAKGWQGKILQADIQSQQFSNWKLKSAVALNISETTFMLEPLCWLNTADANVCLSLENQNQRWQSKLVLTKFPLSLMSAWLTPDINLNGSVNGSADIQFTNPDQLFGQAKIELLPASISYPMPDGGHEQWDYQGGIIYVTLNEQGLTAESEIIVNKKDTLNFKAALPGMKLLTLDPQQQSIEVEAALSVHDLGFLEALIPEVQDLKGEMAMKLSLAGKLAQPEINAHTDLLNGSVRIPRLGLTISKLKLTGKTDNFKKFNFQLDAHSGTGDIVIQGQTHLDSAAGWPTQMSVKGESFEVSRIPEARVTVSPNLIIKLKQNTIDVQGKVHIPYAKLQPKDITTATRVSQDVVIIGSETAPEAKWLITTKIRLTLGERVNFYGYGFEGRFGGSLLLEDEPGQLTRATGEITIPEGKYQAYGQNLTVEHGRLIYTGGPVTNPGLDIRAIRVVNTITAGLKVRGSLSQPQIELFSIPAMGQTNILSYLLMGAPIENASTEEGSMMAKAALALGLSGGDTLARKIGDEFGLDQMRIESNEKGDQASLVMGRYLSPKLYVSYGVGLVESFNTFRVRYQLSDKWQIKAESGQAQGADILYTIER